MHKYLSFFIGIIIYLIYNHNETFTIGARDAGDICENSVECNESGVDGDGNCNDKCYCYFNKCKSIDSIGQDSDYNLLENNVCGAGVEIRDINIAMLAKSKANPSYRDHFNGRFCDINVMNNCFEDAPMSREVMWEDIEYRFCEETYEASGLVGSVRARFIENCKSTHASKDLCFQECPMKIKTNNSKDLENAGFEHVQLVDLEDPLDREFHFNLDYRRKIYFDEGVETANLYHGLNVAEYHFYKFLEKKYNSKAKKIKNGIVYINSRIFYYTMADSHTRFSIGNLVNQPKVISSIRQFIHTNPIETLEGQSPYSLLHVDFTNVPKWRVDDLYINEWGVPVTKDFTDQTHYQITGGLYNRKVSNMYNEYLPPLDTDRAAVPLTQADLYKKLNKKLKHINIWTKLVGSDDFNSLGIMDTIQDEKLVGDHFMPLQNFRNTLISEMTADKSDEKNTRLNQFGDERGIMINKNDIDTVGDESYDVDLDTLYTYKMNDGDAFVFSTLNSPHVALPHREDEWRFTVENRYAFINKPFDIDQVFVVNSDGIIINQPSYDDNTSLLVNDAETQAETRRSGSEIDFSPLTKGDGFFSIDAVKTKIIYEYNRLQDIYNRAYSELSGNGQLNPVFPLQFDIKRFKFMMDHIRFELFDDNDKCLLGMKLLIRLNKNENEECNPDIEPDICVEGYSCQSASQDPEVELYTCQIEY